MHTILLAVDFSPASRNAAVFAAELAQLLRTKLLLFHAYMLPTPISEVPYAMVTVDNLQSVSAVPGAGLPGKRWFICVVAQEAETITVA